MTFKDLVTVSLRQVFRQRRRFQGVVLAIALGVASITTIVTMSREIKQNINQDLDLIGGVTVIRAYFDNNINRSNRPQWFRDSTVADVGRLSGVKAFSLATTTNGYANRRGEQVGFMLMAVDHQFWQVLNISPLKGQLFGPEAVNGRKRECVLGAELATKIFGDTQVIGQAIEINQENYAISGVLQTVATDSGLDHAAFLPLTTAQDRLPGTLLKDRLYLRCWTWDDVSQVAAAFSEIIKTHQSPERLLIAVGWESLSRLKRVTWWVEVLVYLAIGLTFILGGVGIWNVMMTAVSTRVREIGLKKAMGAEDRDILAQFLFEGLFLSLIGAFLGAGLGRICVELVAYVVSSRPPENLFLLSLIVGVLLSVILGIGAGLYPSLKASRMEAVSAIRFE